jgi:Tol biopolymer transport system component
VYDWKAPRPAPAAGDAKPAAGANRILFLRDGQLTTVDPDGKNEKKVGDRGASRAAVARLSPDGKRVAVCVRVESPDDPKPDEPARHRLYVRELGGKEPGTPLDVDAGSFAWSPDGSEIAYTDIVWGKEGGKDRFVQGVVKVATKEKTPLKLPEGYAILDWSRDGKSFLALRGNDRELPTLHLVSRDGKEDRRLTEEKRVSLAGRLSPDGKRLLYASVIPANLLTGEEVPGSVGTVELRVLDIAAGKSSLVAGVPKEGDPAGFCWSPDGKRIAYAWRDFTNFAEGKLEDKEDEIRLFVCDVDGKNAAKLATWKVKGLRATAMDEVDWR